ncbi:hypothetical protein FNV43_RR22969 [Rhamnella rubrinervis]|uniref:non-specific serine/threonine protein kinase n=1 Tax=Rhamnella rubrinervis TaxID=2594499 RepID=A0A8K0E2X2_9ROSA|nr:hypothetical protein FNV43_RR22969 [Rhamnella rubrinervis]
MHNINSVSFVLLTCFFFCCCISSTNCAITDFSYPSFSANDNNITVNGVASRETINDHASIRLTSNQVNAQVFNGTGRAYHSSPIQLWSPLTNITTDFTTSFEFSIQFVNGWNQTSPNGGIAFFLASDTSAANTPSDSYGGWLGLFNQTTNGSSSSQMVAVEFDTYQDPWDPSNNHVGIDVNSIVSEQNLTWSNTMVSGDILLATVSYNGSSNDLRVHLKDPQVPVDDGSLTLTHKVDLRLCSIFGILYWRNIAKRKKQEEDYDDQDEEMGIIDAMDEDFEMGTGPKRFAYKELAVATNNFSEEGKLGQGGFGGVYKGFLPELNMEIAVKKISSTSKQGKKEYISEVKTISRLRHRNLVQLVGWSHERGNFLLVYEHMPNGSLDSHLFGKKLANNNILSWPLRYKIIHDLAAGMLYLHEEWEQCVVHRDIKASNVMLDSNFTAKLGDFGLARLIDHELGSQTTVVAGTMGYMAPEYLITSKASKESDVFSFGIVALEVGCGRKAVEPKAEECEVSLANWVWGLNGRGRLLEAADEKLDGKYDSEEMCRLLKVGLWCAHPDHSLRPCIRQAIQVLKFEAPLPSLPAQMPVPMYFSQPPNISDLVSSYAWSGPNESLTTTR